MANVVGRISGVISLVLFLIFVANIFYGKMVISFGWKPQFELGNVMEFLLLFLVAIFFVIFTLQNEKSERGS